MALGYRTQPSPHGSIYFRLKSWSLSQIQTLKDYLLFTEPSLGNGSEERGSHRNLAS